jgi:hypothetical protein
LKASPVAWRPRDKLIAIFDQIIQFVVIKTLDPEPYPDSLEMLDPGSVSGFIESRSTTLLMTANRN